MKKSMWPTCRRTTREHAFSRPASLDERSNRPIEFSYFYLPAFELAGRSSRLRPAIGTNRRGGVSPAAEHLENARFKFQRAHFRGGCVSVPHQRLSWPVALLSFHSSSPSTLGKVLAQVEQEAPRVTGLERLNDSMREVLGSCRSSFSAKEVAMHSRIRKHENDNTRVNYIKRESERSREHGSEADPLPGVTREPMPAKQTIGHLGVSTILTASSVAATTHRPSFLRKVPAQQAVVLDRDRRAGAPRALRFCSWCAPSRERIERPHSVRPRTDGAHSITSKHTRTRARSLMRTTSTLMARARPRPWAAKRRSRPCTSGTISPALALSPALAYRGEVPHDCFSAWARREQAEKMSSALRRPACRLPSAQQQVPRGFAPSCAPPP